MIFLTLGVHVQRGLLYFVCVCACVCECVCLYIQSGQSDTNDLSAWFKSYGVKHE